jgi:hypothetical protein
MQKTTVALAFRLTLLSLACSAGVCGEVQAQQDTTGLSPPQVTTLDVNCPDGSVYRISSGTPDGRCTASAFSCINAASVTLTTLSCTTGCATSVDTGSCTRVR